MGKAKIFSAAGRQFAGPMDLSGAPNLPSHWITYFAVADVDEACKKIQRLGGKVCYDPFDMPTIGRTAIVEDPVGTVFHVFTPENTSADVNVMGGEPGQPCWLELLVDDPVGVSKFYKEVLGWTLEEQNIGSDETFIAGKNGDQMVAGILQKTEDSPKTKFWLPYFMVHDIEQAASAAVELGGEQLSPTMTISGIGSFSLFQDPSGALSYLFQNET